MIEAQLKTAFISDSYFHNQLAEITKSKFSIVPKPIYKSVDLFILPCFYLIRDDCYHKMVLPLSIYSYKMI